jgi:hypothetical protein
VHSEYAPEVSDPSRRAQEFYETTLAALEEAKNERLWFKTNLKLCKLWFDMREFPRMAKLLKLLHKSCQLEDGTDDQKKGTQLLEVSRGVGEQVLWVHASVSGVGARISRAGVEGQNGRGRESSESSSEPRFGCTAMRKLRIATSGHGTGRQKMALERWTNPKLSRRTCSPRYELQSREIGGRRATAA